MTILKLYHNGLAIMRNSICLLLNYAPNKRNELCYSSRCFSFQVVVDIDGSFGKIIDYFLVTNFEYAQILLIQKLLSVIQLYRFCFSFLSLE